MQPGWRLSLLAFRVFLALIVTNLSLTAVAQVHYDETMPSWPSLLGDGDGTDALQIAPTLTPAAPATPSQSLFGGPLLERSTLTGDWGGSRSDLAKNGITIDASTTQFYQGVASGGLQQAFRYGGRDDYFLNVDGEKAGLWKGLFINLHGETRYGDSIDSLTGAFMPTNLMLDVPQRSGTVTALTAVKVTQFLSEDLLVYGGRLNMFDTLFQPITGATALNGFMNTAMMFNPVEGRTVPYSTYGAGFAYLKDFQPVFSMVVIDTNNTPTVSGFDTFFNNGITILSVLNLPTRFFELPGHQGAFGTYSTGKYSDLQPTAYFDPILGPTVAIPKKAGSWSFAYNFDQALYASPTNPKKVWGVFGNLGLSDGNPNPIPTFMSLGISGVSPFESRPQDSFGIGYYNLCVSNTLKDLAPKVLKFANEQGMELYYNYAVTPWFHVTPDLQLIDPFKQRAETEFVAGMRGKIDF